MAKVNEGQRDPIQNGRLTDDCWNGKHFHYSRNQDGDWIGCCGYRDSGAACECYCHSAATRPKVSRRSQQEHTMDIMESGCGTIEIK